MIGTRASIQNDVPIVAPFGVNAEGSGDMYYKGGNMLHTIRQIVGNDERWRGILRGLNATFRHQTVTSAQVEAYVSRQAGIDLGKVFDQYLRTTKIPVFEYRIRGGQLSYRWTNAVPGFDMPLKVTLAPGAMRTIRPTAQWQTAPVTVAPGAFRVDENYYVDVKDADTEEPPHPVAPLPRTNG